MAMRPPIDQTLWNAGGMNRGDYDSMFAMRPDGNGPGGPAGMGFGAPPGYPSNMPVIGGQPQQQWDQPAPLLVEPSPQHRWDAQAPGGQDGSLGFVQQLAKLLMGGGGLRLGGGQFEPTPGGSGGDGAGGEGAA